jgi:hypothetical protein
LGKTKTVVGYSSYYRIGANEQTYEYSSNNREKYLKRRRQQEKVCWAMRKKKE